MLNFTVGPVQVDEEIRKIGAEQTPYFRTKEFSKIMLENEFLMKKFAYADENARVVFLTGSGTAAMEAAVINLFNEKDKVLVVNGGSFGHRFAELCKIHQISFTEIKLNFGQILTVEMLKLYENCGYTSLLINVHETSTGVYYNIDMIGEFCKNNGIFLVVDAISSFIADPFNMKELGVGVMITGSQKALALPPGISIIVMSKEALIRVNKNTVKCMYFDLKSALKNGERGQTPFTPAVTILLQINKRLQKINEIGIENEMKKIKTLADDFRNRIKKLPLKITSESMSNAATPLTPFNVSAYDVFTTLKDKYNIWICPNGGELADKLFRVGHMGDLTIEDNTKLIDALNDMQGRNLL